MRDGRADGRAGVRAGVRAVTPGWWHRPLRPGSPSGARRARLDGRREMEDRGGLAHLSHEPGDVQAREPAEVVDRAVVHESIGRDAEDPDSGLAVRRIREPGLFDRLEDSAPEPTRHDALLDREHE